MTTLNDGPRHARSRFVMEGGIFLGRHGKYDLYYVGSLWTCEYRVVHTVVAVGEEGSTPLIPEGMWHDLPSERFGSWWSYFMSPQERDALLEAIRRASRAWLVGKGVADAALSGVWDAALSGAWIESTEVAP